MNTLVRLSGDLPTIQKLFFRNFVAMIFAFIAMLKNGDSFKPKPGSTKFLVLSSVAGLVGVFGNFYALDRIELSNASMLNKMSPFFVLLFSALFLKEKVKPKQAIAIAGAFIGAMFIIKPTFAMKIRGVPCWLCAVFGVRARRIPACAGSAITVKIIE
jgi:drug/metabolite transporter (DMT)-like permease